MALATWSAESIPSLAGRVALITGGNDGIGLEVAKNLLAAGAYVIIASRNSDRVHSCVATLSTTYPGRVEGGIVDLSGSLSAIAAFAKSILAKHEAIHMLICNAGTALAPFRKTPDGFEATMAVNHVGHAALTRALLPAVRRAAPARIVFIVTKDDVMKPPTAGDTFNLNVKAATMNTYGQAKFCAFVYARSLAAELKAAGVPVDVACVHPGAVKTAIAGKMAGCMGPLIGCATAMLGQTVKEAAIAITYAASSPAFAGKSFEAFNPPKSGLAGHAVPWYFFPGSKLQGKEYDAMVYAETNAVLMKHLGADANLP